MAVEIHQLRYFVAVAERRHFTQAAADLAVAQPSVSRQIRKLEGELGAPLFQRARGDIALTQAGEALLPWAKRVLADVDGARHEVRDLAGLARGRLSVGATPSLTTVVLPALLARFHAEHPGIELVLHEAGSRVLLERLEQGDVELALVILPIQEESFATTPLFREELVLAVPRDHRFARRHSVRVADLRDVPLVMFREGYDLRSVTIAACQQAGFEPIFALEGGEMDGVLRMTAAGLGVAVVPSSVIEQDGPLVAIRLADPPLERTVGLAHRRDWTLSPAAVRFAALLTTESRGRRRQ